MSYSLYAFGRDVNKNGGQFKGTGSQMKAENPILNFDVHVDFLPSIPQYHFHIQILRPITSSCLIPELLTDEEPILKSI